MEFTCRGFAVGKCRGQKSIDGEAMPLVLQPAPGARADGAALAAALAENRDWFERMIIKNSAVLVRGFGVRNAEEFNDVVRAFGWEDIRYVGPAPRTHVHDRVWTANEGPLSEFIYYHHEMVLSSYSYSEERYVYLLPLFEIDVERINFEVMRTFIVKIIRDVHSRATIRICIWRTYCPDVPPKGMIDITQPLEFYADQVQDFIKRVIKPESEQKYQQFLRAKQIEKEVAAKRRKRSYKGKMK